MITIRPFLGLANRMRAINSAAALAIKNNMPLNIIWVKDRGINARFTDIFEIPRKQDVTLREPDFSIHNLRLTIHYPLYMSIIKFLLKTFEKNVFILNKPNEGLHDFDSISSDGAYIAAYNEFYNSELVPDIFKPKEKILIKIREINETFSENTYGMHIRRTDNFASINSSPSNLFDEKIQSILELEPDALFFVASDSDDEKNRLIKEFPGKIITNFFEVSRSKLEGIENAVVDMFLLGETKKIYGSFWSSFSEMAAKIGKKTLEILKT